MKLLGLVTLLAKPSIQATLASLVREMCIAQAAEWAFVLGCFLSFMSFMSFMSRQLHLQPGERLAWARP